MASFLNLVFIGGREGCKGREQMQGDGELSRVGMHDGKSTKNQQKLKINCPFFTYKYLLCFLSGMISSFWLHCMASPIIRFRAHSTSDTLRITVFLPSLRAMEEDTLAYACYRYKFGSLLKQKRLCAFVEQVWTIYFQVRRNRAPKSPRSS